MSETRLSTSVAAAFAAAVLAAPLASQAAEHTAAAATAAASATAAAAPSQSLKASPAAVQHLMKASVRLRSTVAMGIWPEVTHVEAVA